MHGALREVEGAAFVDGEDAPADVEVGVKDRIESADLEIVLVDPDGTGEVAEGFLRLAVNGYVVVAGEVKEDRRASVYSGAAGAGELHDGEQLGDGNVRSAGGMAEWSFLSLGDEALHDPLLLLLLAGAERMAVFADELVDFVSVDEEDAEVAGFGGLDAAVAVEPLDGLLLAVGVVFAEGVQLALVGDDFAQEGGGVGDGLRARGFGL